MSNKGVETLKGSEDVFVDVVDFSRGMDIGMVAKEDPDATENSSSFANSTSRGEDTSVLSDAEVDSKILLDDDLEPFDGFSSMFPMRRKKLTTHWRNFIRPLMWRSKWTELRIKELESQASNYARFISAHNRRKQMALDQTLVEQHGSKSLPFTHQRPRKVPLERRKRNRTEDTTDTTSYMSNHNLFTEPENKRRSDVDKLLGWEDLDNSDHNNSCNDEFGINDDCLYPEDNDNILEHILKKIELVQAQVHKLKGQLESVMVNNADKFSSSENLSKLISCYGQTSCARSPTLSACNGDMAFGVHSQHISEYDELGDCIMPDSAVSSYGEVIPVPDIIESTVGILSSIDVSQLEAQVGDSSEKIVDNIMTHNEAAEVDRSMSENKHDQSAEKTRDTENDLEDVNNATHFASDPHSMAKAVASEERSTLKPCSVLELHFPKNKRKRGERKAGSGSWSRQRPGEPCG